jgi:hypothetical protein
MICGHHLSLNYHNDPLQLDHRYNSHLQTHAPTFLSNKRQQKFSSLLQLLCMHTSSLISMDPSSDDSTKWVTGHFVYWLLFLNSILSSILPPNIARFVHPPQSLPLWKHPQNQPPISGTLIHAVSKQLGSTPGPETPPTVSNYAVLMIVDTNYWSFTIHMWSAVVHYHPLYLVLLCKQPRD